jgi:ribosome-binding factor A
MYTAISGFKSDNMKILHDRVGRLSDLIKREVSEILIRDVKDPRLRLVTITHAEVAKDMRKAKIFFSTLRKGKDLTDTLQSFEKAKGFIQKKLAERLHIRYIPHLMFFFDPSLEHGARMQQIFKDLNEQEECKEDC